MTFHLLNRWLGADGYFVVYYWGYFMFNFGPKRCLNKEHFALGVKVWLSLECEIFDTDEPL